MPLMIGADGGDDRAVEADDVGHAGNCAGFAARYFLDDEIDRRAELADGAERVVRRVARNAGRDTAIGREDLAEEVRSARLADATR